MVGQHARELISEELQVLAEEQHILLRSIVQVKPDAGQSALSRRYCRPVGSRRTRPQVVALEHAAEQRDGCLQERYPLRASRCFPCDDQRSAGLLPTLDQHAGYRRGPVCALNFPAEDPGGKLSG
jgi:hypothetical protein